jgi:fibronectin type 3 domain-containing protein
MNIRKLSFSSLLFSLLALVLTGCPEVVKAVTNPPPTPVNFTANAASASTINLSWSSSQGATGYKLERKTGTAAFAQIATPNGTTYSDTGLTGSTAYTYRLIANNINGDSAGAESSATTSATAPVAPTEFTASATSSTEIALNWKASVGATGYKLERKTGTAAFAPIGTPTGISYKDTELTGNTAYTYRLVASNSGGDSPAVESSATTKTVTTSSPPTTPTDFAANVTSSTTISLSWTASANATGYKLERKTGSAVFAQIATPSGVTYADTGLIANTTYSYRLVANNTVGDSPAVEVTATTQAVVVVSPPAAPTGFAADVKSSTEIVLSWNASKGATSYKLERKTDKEPFVSLAAPQKLTAYTDSGLKENTAYTYRLVASNADGDSTPVEITATTQVVVGNLPAAPKSFIATANSSSTISLSWDAATGATGYKLERKTGAAAYIQIATPSATTYNDTGLNASTAYLYRLVANNANGDSAAVESSATTQAVVVLNPPEAPTGFKVIETSSNYISLSWDESKNAKGYRLERRTVKDKFLPIATIDVSRYDDKELTSDTTFIYRLVAFNGDGDSKPVEVTGSTQAVVVGNPPATPTGFFINAYTKDTISMYWDTVPNATSYKLERKSGNGAFAQVASQADHFYTDIGLTGSTTYTYRLVASNAYGDSAPTEASATTLVDTSVSDEINAYFKGLPSWVSTHPLLPDSDTVNGPASSDQSTVIEDLSAESKKRRYSCVTTPYSLTQTPNKIVTLSPDAGKFWLGGLLQGDGYVGGLGSLKELPIRERAPLKIYIDLIGQGVVETIDAPDAASLQTAIGTLVDRAKALNTPFGSYIDYDKKETSSTDELALKLGLSVKYLGVDVKTRLNVDRKVNTKTLSVVFTQKAFTVQIVGAQTPAKLFSNDFTIAKLNEQKELGRISPANLPVIVSNIVYGRKMILSMTSSASSLDIQAVLDGSYQAAGNGVTLNLDVRLKKVLDESKVKATTVGGNDAYVEGLFKAGELYKYFEKTPDPATYKPLSYQVDNLGDGSAAKFTETTDYNLKECSPMPNNATKAGEVAKLTLTKIMVPLKTDANTQNCYQTRFGAQGADLFGNLSLDSVNWVQIVKDSNKFIDVGGEYAITPQIGNIETLPDDIYPPRQLKPNERVFLDGTGGNYVIQGILQDAQGFEAPPANNINLTESYPFVYGTKIIYGNSANCKLNVEYNLEKIVELVRYTP